MDHLILDISRSVLRASHAAPTGIDRVERAYFEWALRQTDRPVAFLCRIYGWQALLDREMAARYFEESERTLNAPEGHPETLWERRARQGASRFLAAVRARISFRTKYWGRVAFWRVGVDPRRAVYLNVSHSNTQIGTFRLLRALGVPKTVAFIHDVIPIEHPEFFRPNSVAGFRKRFDAITRNADGLIFNSAFSQARALGLIEAAGRTPPPSIVAHLGVHERWLAAARAAPPSPPDHPYFVTLGTIEPRKNHLLLLNLWRRLSQNCPNPPHLHLIGWRGWENENVLDVLDRSPMVGRTVFEHRSASDAEVLKWVRGAQAVLYPSFVEGFGMPIIEALAAGAPVICSDIPVFREVANHFPEYLDPLDGPGWLAAVNQFISGHSDLRSKQLERIPAFKPPTWCDHFEIISDFAATL